MSVVNQYGRVHGIEGLPIADISIIPDCPDQYKLACNHDRRAIASFMMAKKPRTKNFRTGLTRSQTKQLTKNLKVRCRPKIAQARPTNSSDERIPNYENQRNRRLSPSTKYAPGGTSTG
ncbi:MAG: hypothetical protein Ct9H300mP19_16910 [Dehalococcoidia bacterium]|nr:MAG: hypothetical protein Ct9H300mP19_16910 [Dehalococcoidia bacterium]